MSALLFFIHQNDSRYLKYTINQAKYLNPNNEVYLIGDVNVRNLHNIHVADINMYRTNADELRKVYKHLSRLPYEFEYFCIARWFILAEFLKKNNLADQPFFHIDSDVLLFPEINDAVKRFEGYDLSASEGTCGHNSYFRNLSELEKFTDFIISYYTNPEKLRLLEDKYAKLEYSNKGWISDMTFLNMYISQNKSIYFEPTTIFESSTFDHNINSSEGYLMSGNIKKIKITDNIAYCYHLTTKNWIRHFSLHFQSIGKGKIHRFYISQPAFLKDKIIDEMRYIIFFKIGTQIRLRKRLSGFWNSVRNIAK